MAMTDEDIIADLKQFIAATVSQEVSRLDVRMDGLERHIRIVDKKIDDLSVFVFDALDNSNDATEAKLKDHERRITHLEKRTA